MAEPKNKMLKLGKNSPSFTETLTKNPVIPFLNEKSLYALTWTNRHNRNQYKDKHADKKTAAEMLHCVLNPTLSNQTRFGELLSRPKQDKNGLPLYLIPNHGEEVYFNKAGTIKTKTKRYSTNVLEAILITKNFYLARLLFLYIPEHEKTKNLKKYISMVKSQEIWGMHELQIAYKNFLDPFETLHENCKWYELGRLVGQIGKVQKEKLPWFSIYLFCNPVFHVDYESSSIRKRQALELTWTCILDDQSNLDLDLLDGNHIYALFKGGGKFPGNRASTLRLAYGCALYDSMVFSKQYEMLSSEMDKAIKWYGLDIRGPALDPAKKLRVRI